MRRLRLERAAAHLRNTNRSVLEIALEAGYQAHESFTRAFEAAFHTQSIAVAGPAETAARMERIGPLTVVRLRHVGPYNDVGDGEHLGFDAAFTVPRAIAGEGEIQGFELPARDYVTAVH